MYNFYFIGNDTNNLFPQILQAEILNNYISFASTKDYILSESNKNLCPDINVKCPASENILICDKINLNALENNTLLNNFVNIFIYEDFYEMLINAFNNIKFIYKERYNNNYDYNFLNTRLNLLKKDDSTKILITGLSYALMGLDENLFKYKACNLSLSSQDLYYSYKLSKDIISFNDNIKCCVIGLSYYSLHFDLSLCGEAAMRINPVYLPLLGDSHNFKTAKESFPNEEYLLSNYLNTEITQLFNSNEIENIFKNILYEELSKNYFNSDITRESITGTYQYIGVSPEFQRDSLGAFRGTHHNNLLVHSHTVDENTTLLGEFLSFLNKRKIQPLLCVFPFTSYYEKYFSKDFSINFYKCINTYKNIYDFTLVDLNNFEEINIMDFIDADHLNYNGAIKATNIVNQFIN